MPSLTRRRFMVAGSALPLSVATGSAAEEEKKKPTAAKPAKKGNPLIAALPEIPGPPVLEAGPMLGHVGDTEAWLWVKASKETAWRVLFSESPDFMEATTVEGERLTHATARTAKCQMKGLNPSTRYFYRVLFDERTVSTTPDPCFLTAPSKGARGPLRVAFGSCVGRLPEHSAAAFGEMAACGNFDLLLMLGDNHYGDTTDLERLRLYYTAHRRLAGFRELSATHPVYAIWDDHDYGPNNSDGTEPGKERSRQAFREFWANAPRAEAGEDAAIYHTFERAGVAFFMLDVRWHRSPNKQPDGEGKTMLGARQLAWLKDRLKACTAPVKVIASGSEWQSHGHNDSWAAFLTERDALLGWMAAEAITGVIFLSGDRHFSAGYHIRDRWIELTAGPLGSANSRDPKVTVSPETFMVRFNGKMWMILDIDTAPPEPLVTAEIWEAGAGLIESRKLPWAVLCGQGETMERSKVVLEVLEEQKRLRAKA